MVNNTTGTCGMMWHDGTNKKAEKLKVLEAIAYYRLKYKKDVERIFINVNSDFDEKDIEFKEIIIEKVKDVLPNNYWLIIENSS
jgi:Zn/Cd-binding protein ZinT